MLSRTTGPTDSSWTWTLPLEHGDLLTQGQDFQRRVMPTTEEDSNGSQQSKDESEHEYLGCSTLCPDPSVLLQVADSKISPSFDYPQESAKSLNRPGLQRLMALVNGGKVQAVIVAKLDRLTRSVKDLCGLLELFEKRKVALISVAEALDTGSAAGRLVITIMGAVSQWEREAIGERTRDALRHKRGNGERIGNIEFGYHLSPDLRHVEPEPAEQAALAEIRSLRHDGHTLRGIATTLNNRGRRTRRGTHWRLESVARVIKQNAQPHAKIA